MGLAVTQYGIRYLDHHWCKVMACHLLCAKPLAHYLNQCCPIVKWTLKNKLRWNFNQNTIKFNPKDAFENVVCKMSSILFMSDCLNCSICSQQKLYLVSADRISIQVLFNLHNFILLRVKVIQEFKISLEIKWHQWTWSALTLINKSYRTLYNSQNHNFSKKYNIN